MTEADARIGVVIPIHNREDVILRTLESVAAQSVLPSLIVGVDDGSIDRSAEIVADWASRRPELQVRLLGQANCGVSVARNVGWEVVRHLDFVAFLDSDDEWPVDFLSSSWKALSTNDAAVGAVADRLMVSDCGSWRLESKLSEFVADPLDWLFRNDAGLLSCMLLRVEAVSRISLFDPHLSTGEDIEFLGRLCLQGPLCHAPGEPVRFYRDLHKSRSGASNLSDSHSDSRYQWAIIYEGLYREAATRVTPEQRSRLHRGLAKKWRAAGLQDLANARRARAARCFLRAWRWRPTNLGHLVRATAAIAGGSVSL